MTRKHRSCTQRDTSVLMTEPLEDDLVLRELKRLNLRSKWGDRRQFFSKCRYKALNLKVGDFVHISGEKSHDPNDEEQADVGEILFLFQNDDPDFRGDRCRAIVQLYVKHQCLPPLLRAKYLKFDYEVFKDSRFDPEISVETIFGLCHVEFRNLFDTSRPSKKKEDPRTYICQYSLKARTKTLFELLPVLSPEVPPSPKVRRSKMLSPIKDECFAIESVKELKIVLKRTSSSDYLTPKKPLIERRKSILKTPNSASKEGTPRKRVSMSAKLETHHEFDDDENVTPPKRRRGRPSLSETPKGRKILSTPDKRTPRARALFSQVSVGSRVTPVKSDGEQMQVARERLHVSAVPETLPCREREFREIFNFLEDKLLDDCGGCMYVSGVPGTGKTATTTEVLRTLQKAAKKGEVPDFDFIDINGMRLTEPRQAYVHIYRQIAEKTVSWEQAYQILDKRFSTSSTRRKLTILLVDELDILCNKRQDVVYNLLNWPSLNSSKLVVVTIANTMDLPERLLMGKITSRLGLTRLTFQPYTFQQLQEIIVARLEGTETFSKDAVQLVARKVAAVSGDARRALDICRRATEIAEAEKGARGVVSIGDVQKALAEMIASPKMQFIKSCTRYEKMWLQAVCTEVTRTGVDEVIFHKVYTHFEAMATFERVFLPSASQTLGICTRLGASRVLICEHGRKDLRMKIMLNMSVDDVHFALHKDQN